jgi:hypothetical protein
MTTFRYIAATIIFFETKLLTNVLVDAQAKESMGSMELPHKHLFQTLTPLQTR